MTSFMKKTFLALLGVLLLSIPDLANAATVNINQSAKTPKSDALPQRKPVLIFQDIPLYQNLEIIRPKDELLLYGTRPENIVETTGLVDVDTIYYYYQDELPKRGWTAVNGRSFTRAGMRLDIDAKSSNDRGRTYVRFALSSN